MNIRPPSTEPATHPEAASALPLSVGADYDADYFSRYGESGERYSWGSRGWEGFFDGIADAIVDVVHPRTVLDIGCAVGFLVGALRARGVEAWGIDISEYALRNVAPSLRPYCVRASVADGLRGRYDLITAIEVFEHLRPSEAELSLDAVTTSGDAVLFSSTPVPNGDPTHVNERPIPEWVAAFMRRGFHRDFAFNTQVVSPAAFLVRRSDDTPEELVAAYEADRLRLEDDLRRLQAGTIHARARRVTRIGRDLLNHIINN